MALHTHGNADGAPAHGVHYVMPDGRSIFIGQQSVDDSAMRAMSPLARAVMRDHLNAAIRLLDEAHVKASSNAR
jgi:hypothetical protein